VIPILSGVPDLHETCRAAGLFLVSTPMPDEMFTVTSHHRRWPWERIQAERPALPLPWWLNLRENAPIGSALSWAVQKGFVYGPVEQGPSGLLLVRTAAGQTQGIFEYRSDNLDKVARNLFAHIKTVTRDVRVQSAANRPTQK
jgi:hypothetical protein